MSRVRNPFRVGDIVVVKRSAALGQTSRYYDFSRWALTRLKVTLSDGDSVVVQAVDPRPDLDYLSKNDRLPDARESAQNAQMSWPLEDLEFFV